MTSQPEAILIAGANGAGKTTFARQFLRVRYPAATFLNADEIQREGPAFAHPVAAGRELLRRLDEFASLGKTFAVETTLSSRSYVERLRSWAASGYRTCLHFIELPSADHAVQRVATRVAAGGHAVRSGHPEALREGAPAVLHRLQAPRGSVVSLAQRRSRTSTCRPTTQLGWTTRNSRSCSRRPGGRPGMRSTDQDTSGPAVSTPATRTAMALTRPPNSTQEPTSRDQGSRETKAPRTRLAAQRDGRWPDPRRLSASASDAHRSITFASVSSAIAVP